MVIALKPSYIVAKQNEWFSFVVDSEASNLI